MAWTRLAQFTGEHRVLTDIALAVASRSPALSQVQVKSGAWAYRSQASNAFGYAAEAGISHIRMGYWMYLANASVSGSAYLYVAAGGQSNVAGTPLLRVWYDPSLGKIELSRIVNSSTSETSTEKVYTYNGVPAELSTTGAWFPVGIYHKIDAVAGVFSLYIGGTLIFTHTGDTRPAYWTGSAQAFADSALYFLGAGGYSTSSSAGFGDMFIDDMYIDQGTGAEEDEAPPARRFGAIYVTAAGANAQFTPSTGSNYQNVDENPHDSDTTRNIATAADKKDTFNFDDLFVLPAQHAIVQVIVTAFAKRLDTGIDSRLRFHAYNGTVYSYGSDLALKANYNQPIFDLFPLAPDGAAWTSTKLNAAQFGYESRGTF